MAPHLFTVLQTRLPARVSSYLSSSAPKKRNMTNYSEAAANAGCSKPLINLLRGWPHPSLLPTELMHRATTKVLRDPSISTPGFLYGPDAGYQPLRENVAKWLTSFYKPPHAIGADRICITGGASQNMGCIMNVFTDPSLTRNVWCVAPAYMLMFRVFEDAGLGKKLRAVSEDEEGIDLEFLKEQLQKSEEKARSDGNDAATFKPPRPWGKIYRHIIYAVPTFSNPSFKTMTLRRREALVRLAREYDALIVTDDVYDFLQWKNDSKATTTEALDTAVQPRIVDIDRFLDGGVNRAGADGFGNSASNGSFSKIAGPGLRTGWVEGSEKFAYGVSQTGTSRSGGAPSQFTATLVSDMLEHGALQDFILHTLQPAYASRYRKMLAAIETHLLPLGARLPQLDREIVGGYFIWLTLPAGLDSSVVVNQAKEDNLVVAGGRLFEVPGDSEKIEFGRDVRLCFAWEDEDKLAEGIERLAAVIKRLLAGQGSRDTSSAPDKNFW